MKRFGNVALNIRNLNPKVGLLHMVTTLRQGPFAHDLCMTPIADLDGLRQRATKFMELEELKDFRNKVRVKTMSTEEKSLDWDLAHKVYPS